MGQNYMFDSANPDNKGSSPFEVVRDVHKAIARCTTTTVFDKNDRAVAIETDEDTLGSLPAEVQALVKSQLRSEGLKNAVNEEIDQIKREPLNKGDTWGRMKTANFGAGQVMDFKSQFTYEGTIERDGKTLDKITTKSCPSPLPRQVAVALLAQEQRSQIRWSPTALSSLIASEVKRSSRLRTFGSPATSCSWPTTWTCRRSSI